MRWRRLLAVGGALAGLSLGLTACNGWPDTISGNSVGLAQGAVGTTRAQNPPWNLGDFDCWNFINWVEDHAMDGGTPVPGYHDVTSQSEFAAFLQPDPFGLTYGDIVTFEVAGQPGAIVHAGIVEEWAPGQTDFSSIEWNSPENPDEVVVNQHPTSGAGPDGLVVAGVYIP